MSNNQKNDAQGAFNRLILTLTDANEMTRNKASAVAMLASAMFNALTPDQQEKVLASLEGAFNQAPSAIAGVNAEIEAELSYFLPAYAARRKLS